MDKRSIVDSEFKEAYDKLVIKHSSGAISEDQFEEEYEAIRSRRAIEIMVILDLSRK